jgi:Na+/serine symporter
MIIIFTSPLRFLMTTCFLGIAVFGLGVGFGFSAAAEQDKKVA